MTPLDSASPEYLSVAGVNQWDSYFAGAATRGLRVTAVLTGGDGFGGSIPTGTAAATYADAAAALAKRFGPGGDYWNSLPAGDARKRFGVRYLEVWNEPYFMNNQIPNLAELARLTYIKVKAANPRVRVLVPGEAWFTGSGRRQYSSMFAALAAQVPDIADHFDGVAVHPYTTNGSSNPTTCDAGNEGCFLRLGTVRQNVDAIGGAGKPLVITEEGSSTCTGNSFCVSNAVQATRLAEVLNTLRATTTATADPWQVDGYLYYNYHSSESDPSDKEHWFGLTGGNSDTSNPPNQYTDLKPAWTTFQTQAARGL
jgi:hypothetical protein